MNKEKQSQINYWDTPYERITKGDYYVEVMSYLLGYTSPEFNSDWEAEDLANDIAIDQMREEEANPTELHNINEN